MSHIASLLKYGMISGTVLAVVLLILLSLPESKLRDVLLPIAKKLGFALLCAIYVLSPVDFIPEIVAGPFGLVDDLGAGIAGLIALRSAFTKPRD